MPPGRFPNAKTVNGYSKERLDGRGWERMKPPQRIYLQLLDEDGDEPDEVTWCVDRVHDTDVAYVLEEDLPTGERRQT